MLKVLRVATIILFVVAVGLFSLFFVHEQRTTDNTIPEIKVDGEMLEVSISATDEDLLKGVTAFDKKDGDITGKIVVESVSQFLEEGVCKVTYAVCDSDKHVVKNSRHIKYVDYTSPQFTMNRPLVFFVDEEVDIIGSIGAIDSIDGDISDKVVLTATDYTTDTIGVFTVTLQATNSMGDIIYLDLPLHIEETSVAAPIVELKEYLTYVKKGEKPDFKNNISAVSTRSGQAIPYESTIETNFDSNTPGVYSVHYYITNELGYQCHSILTVVVEE
ncbi:MAG: hypothetical protein IKT55_04200 [Clostridia bacterium]|nr:hypothetical protein [Clostridia bacterium]